LNQQQLQIARAALWHQNAAPLLTYDDAASWLDETGICLFLPRHTQLPAPAPSFVEACLGTQSVTPPASAIAPAMDLAIRLVDAGRAIPLNLLGGFSEQPDFLITPEVLPWVAAVRGERQWKTGPGNRSAPIVVRAWEALDQHGAQTAVEIQNVLGRELTEAAVLRALVELWTTLRAVPAYTAGEPTRWSLLKDRYPSQLATGANTAQPTALSALISLYLRSAVAATGEETEIFLSPLTARSRIRDVVHGMTAARQVATMSVGTNTLLFVEGSLPETLPVEEVSPAGETPAAAPQHDREQREAIRKGPREERGARPREGRPPRREFRPAAGFGGKKTFGDRPRPAGAPRPFVKRDGPPGDGKPQDRKFPPRFAAGSGGGDRPARPAGDRPAKPWQKPAGGAFRPAARGDRPAFPRREGAAGGAKRPWQRERPEGRPRREDRGGAESRPPRTFGAKPFDRPRGAGAGKKFPAKPRFGRPGPGRPGAGRPAAVRPPVPPTSAGGESAAPARTGFIRPGPGMPRIDAGTRRPPAGKSGPRSFGVRTGRPGASGPRKFGAGKFGAGKPRAEGDSTRAPRKFGSGKPAGGKFGPRKFGAGKSGPGKFGAAKSAPGKSGPRDFAPRKSGPGKFGPKKFGAAKKGGGKFAKAPGKFAGTKPPRKPFGKPAGPGGMKPRKNRKEEKPE
jgi:hypothetical protein